MAEADLPDEDALLAFILRYIQATTNQDEIIVRAERGQEFLVLFGLLQRVRRLAQAYLRLRKSGFAVEGHLLVRSALEHAITAQWAYLTVDGIDRLSTAGARHQYELIALLDLYSTEPQAERLAEYKDSIPTGPGMPTVGTIIKDLDDSTGFLRQSYRVLSQAGHVTHDAHFHAFHWDGDEVTIRDAPENELDQQVLYALAGACMLSAWVMADLQGNAVEQRRLAEQAQPLHLSWRLDHHLPIEKRRFEIDD